ncbi:MAG: putative lipid II flippase FtsW [Candidatus Adiutrix sp.]
MVEKRLPLDAFLLVLILSLSGLGLVMLLSASSIMAETRFGHSGYFFKPQMRHMLLGLIVMFTLYRVPYQFWAKMAYPVLAINLILLILVLVPGMGHTVSGATRWLRFAGISIQPSEIAKLSIVFYLAYSLSRKGDKAKTFFHGFVPHLLVLGLTVSLILLEPDLGTAICVVLIAFTMMFVAGAKISHMLGLVLMGLPLLYYQIVNYPYRIKRIAAFLDPWADPQGAGYHIIHSFYAFASGGIWGQGPGAGQQKLFFLPEAHTDFIFSVAAEELGLIGVIVIALLFLALCFRGLSIARSACDMCGVYMAIGTTMVVALPAFLNMGVVVALFPTKGLPLPFFSYGGTYLLICFAAMGILLNVAAQGKGQITAPKRNPSQAANLTAKTSEA